MVDFRYDTVVSDKLIRVLNMSSNLIGATSTIMIRATYLNVVEKENVVSSTTKNNKNKMKENLTKNQQCSIHGKCVEKYPYRSCIYWDRIEQWNFYIL